jgi:hypothetical protein
VSKLLPHVSTVTSPLKGAVHTHHTEAPPALSPWFGSPGSLLAPALLPDTVPLAPEMLMALAQLSFDAPEPPSSQKRI